MRNFVGQIMAALAVLLKMMRPPIFTPRIIKHNGDNPFTKRVHGKVVAGGEGGFSFGFLHAVAMVAVVGIFIAGALLTASHAAAADPGAFSLAIAPMVAARELRQERAQLFKENRALIEKAEGEKRDFTSEEQAEYDRRGAAAEALLKRAERLERLATDDDTSQRDGDPRPDARDRGGDAGQGRVIKREFRTGGAGHLTGTREYRIADSEEQHGQKMRRFEIGLLHPADRTKDERRALQMDSDEAGGYLTAPQQFVADVIQAVDNMLFFRGLARVDTLLGAQSIGRPSLDADPDDADWTSELATGSEDSTMDFGKRELVPHPLAKLLKVSRKLIRNSPRADTLVRERLAYKLAVPQEKGFMTGTGSQQPLGIFTADSSGISTGRDVSTGNNTTSPTFDGLKEAKWALKQQYWRNAQWIMNRACGKLIDKLKDGEGQYIWQPSVIVGQPDRLLGLPINFSEYAPSTFTTGQYVAVLGDFSNYWIVESLAMELQRLDELYAATNQIGYICRAEIDGMPVLEEAFVRVKLG